MAIKALLTPLPYIISTPTRLEVQSFNKSPLSIKPLPFPCRKLLTKNEQENNETSLLYAFKDIHPPNLLIVVATVIKQHPDIKSTFFLYMYLNLYSI